MLFPDQKSFLKTLPKHPGVYQMFNASGKIIYVGKAKNLKNRVANYFQENKQDLKKHVLMQQVIKIEVTITANENEAFLLEGNLIKQHKPRYNILFKDDKSFPYLVLSKEEFPRLFSYRGAKEPGYEYFGPYPNSLATRETLHFGQKIFQIRSCNNIFFRNRSRPCLLYQIKRCSAPCVGYIQADAYQKQVTLLMQLLRGKNRVVLDVLNEKMQQAAKEKNFELAAQYRDQISYIRDLQTPQRVTKNGGNSDIIALVEQGGIYCVQIMFVRFDAIIGSKVYFPNVPEFTKPEEVLVAFLTQQYLSFAAENGLPDRICLNINFSERSILQTTLSSTLSKKINILIITANSKYYKLMQLALINAEESLKRHLTLHSNLHDGFLALQKTLQMKEMPKKIECFDISHSSGEATIAACVVFTLDGPQKNAYRRFNIEGIKANDDYAAMYQALYRHYQHLKNFPEQMPDILLIDGGLGQLNIANRVLEALEINSIILLSIAKDPERKSGVDFIYRSCLNDGVLLDCDPQALHLLQQIRDETHRFAVSSHRQKRAKKRKGSILENVIGIGKTKRLALYKHFGGLQEVKKASIEDLMQVKGINRKLAEEIIHLVHNK